MTDAEKIAKLEGEIAGLKHALALRYAMAPPVTYYPPPVYNRPPYPMYPSPYIQYQTTCGTAKANTSPDLSMLSAQTGAVN